MKIVKRILKILEKFFVFFFFISPFITLVTKIRFPIGQITCSVENDFGGKNNLKIFYDLTEPLFICLIIETFKYSAIGIIRSLIVSRFNLSLNLAMKTRLMIFVSFIIYHYNGLTRIAWKYLNIKENRFLKNG